MPQSSYGYVHVRVLLTGGGSGGHIYPLLAVAEHLRKIASENHVSLDLFYLGPKDEYAKALEPTHTQIGTVISGKIRRYAASANILDIPKFFIGFIESLFKLYFIMPDVIFSKGGTGALPVVLAGWFYKIPIIIHESDTVPGLTNSISSRFASRIAVSFPKALDYFDPQKTAVVGTPVRTALLQELPTQAEAKASFGFDPSKPLTLILGGSQGAQTINEFMVTNLAVLLKETQILHQTGAANFSKVEYLSRAVMGETKPDAPRAYLPLAFLDEKGIKTALKAADLVISRAGSGTIAEVSAFGKPSILIPLQKAAGNHQKINAYEYSKTGAAIVIEESNLLPAILVNQIRTILQNNKSASQMSVAAKNLFKPDAAEILAREIIQLGA